MGNKGRKNISAGARHGKNSTQTTLDDFAQEHNPGQGEFMVDLVMTDINIYQLVDSWRSYKNDASSSLQVTISGQAELNPAAAPFKPGNGPQMPYTSHYAPLQPLRSSKRVQEKQALHANWRSFHTSAKNQESDITDSDNINSGSVSPYDPDEPVSSVETSTNEGKDATNDKVPVRKVKSYDRKQSRTPTTSRSITPPPTPLVAHNYREQASLPPTVLSSTEFPRKLLIILDLNGTLLYRPSRRLAPSKIQIRPGVTPFLDYLFDNHVVMIYTSARPENATGMVDNLIHPQQRRKLAALWARDKLDLTHTQYHNKVQVYKKLDKVWGDADVQATVPEGVERWDQSNTVLIDDSRLKALAQPHNLLQVPEYTKADFSMDPRKRDRAVKIQMEIMKQLEMKLEELKWQNDVSQLIRSWQAGERSVPKVEGQEISVDETIDVREIVQKNEQAQQRSNDEVQQSDAVQSQNDADVQDSHNSASRILVEDAEHDKPLLDLTNRMSGLGHLSSSSALAVSNPPTEASADQTGAWKDMANLSNEAATSETARGPNAT